MGRRRRSKTARIMHRSTLKKINIALCITVAVLIVALMFLMMKRKEAVAQADNARQTYEETLSQYSYEGLLQKDAELQRQIDKLNSEISDKTEEINDFTEMVTKAKNRTNAANRFCELAEKYLELLNEGR